MAKKQQYTSGEVSCNGRDSSALSFRQHNDNDTLSEVLKPEYFNGFSVVQIANGISTLKLRPERMTPSLNPFLLAADVADYEALVETRNAQGGTSRVDVHEQSEDAFDSWLESYGWSTKTGKVKEDIIFRIKQNKDKRREVVELVIVLDMETPDRLSIASAQNQGRRPRSTSVGFSPSTQQQLSLKQQEFSSGTEMDLVPLSCIPEYCGIHATFTQQDPRDHVPYRGEVVSSK